MLRSRLPRDALDIVLSIGHRDLQGVVVRTGGNPHIISGHRHRFAITLIRRLLNRRHATRVEHHAPIALIPVLLLKRRALFDSNSECRCRDGDGPVVIVCASSKSGDRKRDGGEQAQGHQEAHQSTAPSEAARGKGRSGPCVLHTVLLSDLILRSICSETRVTGVAREC